MREIHISSPRPPLRRYLSAGYMLFIAYASLSPFTGWQEQGLEFHEVLSAPLMQTYSSFDATVNFLAYLPLGLLFGLSLRAHFGATWCILLATLGGVALSTAMEYAQMYLPMRVSSNLDILTNGIGALAGAILAAGIAPRDWFATHLGRWRARLLLDHEGADFGLALVALWIFAQINPSLPMLGNVFISEAARPPFAIVAPHPLNRMESAAVALNLLMLGLLLLTLLRERRHAAGALLLVLCAVALAKFVAAAVLLKSWALLLWLNSEAMLGIFAGVLALAAASRLSFGKQLWLMGGVALAYLVMTQWILDSGTPSSAMRLYQWHYGHLLNYNGLSQTAALAFPLLLLSYLWRIAARHTV